MKCLMFLVGLSFFVGKSEKGWITFETLYEYFVNCFSKWLTANNIQRPVIVWTDWHETRCNYFLAKRLTELGIIMIGLLPNTMHLLQPLDVSVFGPMKRAWGNTARAYTDKNPDEIISTANFAKIFIPFYYRTMKVDNIKSGFRKCGLFPFSEDSPDYTKLEAAAAQKEAPSTIFIGVDQGGRVEQSTQTRSAPPIHKSIQVQSAGLIKSEVLDKMYPSLKGWAKDDLVVGVRKYELLRESYNSQPIVVSYPSNPTSNSETITQKPAISSAFKDFEFFPERRPGKGPKYVRTDLDRTFAVSNKLIVNEIARGGRKDSKGTAKRSRSATISTNSATTSTSSATTSNSSATTSNNSATASKTIKSYLKPTQKAPIGAGIALTDPVDPLQVQNTSSEEDFEEVDLVSDIVSLSDDPARFSWVGVRGYKKVKLVTGRCSKTPHIYIGKVRLVREDGTLDINYFKEVDSGFWNISVEKGVKIPRESVIVLKTPKYNYRGKETKCFGYEFPVNVRSIVSSYFERQ